MPLLTDRDKGAESANAGLPIRSVSSEFAFLRFTAGLRVMLAALGVLAASGSFSGPATRELLLLYFALSIGLLWHTLRGWPRGSSKVWLWIDAVVLLFVDQFAPPGALGFGVLTVLPVVAVAVLGGSLQALALALVCAMVMLQLAARRHGIDAWSVLFPLILLTAGPLAARLTGPSHAQLRRQDLLDAFQRRSDPRRGLLHHVAVLFELIARQLQLDGATMSLQGLEPRLFQLRDDETIVLQNLQVAVWRDRLATLSSESGFIYSRGKHGEGRVIAVHADGRVGGCGDESVLRALAAAGAEVLTVPLVTYGQPLGQLCVSRSEGAFTAADLQWLRDVMREALPLLERSDLLEQLQRESAVGERERIGRDLHDSAIQPYLGLRYGLEALLRKAGPSNPVAPQITQLLELASSELQHLRGVVSGLRRGQDLTGNQCVAGGAAAPGRPLPGLVRHEGQRLRAGGIAPARRDRPGRAAHGQRGAHERQAAHDGDRRHRAARRARERPAAPPTQRQPHRQTSSLRAAFADRAGRRSGGTRLGVA